MMFSYSVKGSSYYVKNHEMIPIAKICSEYKDSVKK